MAGWRQCRSRISLAAAANVVPTAHVYLYNSDGLVKVMVFHRRRRVYRCERRRALDHERVSLATVVHVVAQTCDKQSQ